jgi:uncharacterized protein YbjQ (UPF0145 family)
MAIFNDKVTTAFELPGHRVVRNHGVVRGIVVRSRSIEIGPGITEVLAYGTAVSIDTAP